MKNSFKVCKFNCDSSKLFVSAMVIGILAAASSNISAHAKENKEYEFGGHSNTMQVNTSSLMMSTSEGFDGYRIKEYRGIVRGVTVRQPTIGQGLKANLKGIVGGRMSPLITMCETARQQAMDAMVERAQAAGANAVVGVRYDSSAFGDSDDMGTEVVCYGTAVVIESAHESSPKTASLLQ